MEKYNIYPTNISTNIFWNTVKNSSSKKLDYNYNTLFIQKKLAYSKKIKFYPITRNSSELCKSNRKYEYDNLYFNSLINNESQNKNLKLEPLNIRKIYNTELHKCNSEYQKNKSCYTNYFKNQSVQSDIYFADESNRYNYYHKNIINFILNKKMKIYRVKKLKEIKLNKSNTFDRLLAKGIFDRKFQRKYLFNSKPIKYYFENKYKASKSSDKKSNISSFLDKNKNLENYKKFYETIELGDKKEIIATKLIYNENDENNLNNIDCHSLMKYPLNLNNNSSGNNYSNLFSNFSSSLRSNCRSINFKSKDSNKYTKDGLKLLSKKGFEKMKQNRYLGISRQIGDTLEDINSNRKKYDSILDINLKLFNKNKEDILNNDL